MRQLLLFLLFLALVVLVVRWFTSQVARSATARGAPPKTEGYYASVLELGEPPAPARVRDAYRQLITKYHPDKVQHLGPEFQRLAEQRTKEINEAYQYFARKYRL